MQYLSQNDNFILATMQIVTHRTLASCHSGQHPIVSYRIVTKLNVC